MTLVQTKHAERLLRGLLQCRQFAPIQHYYEHANKPITIYEKNLWAIGNYYAGYDSQMSVDLMKSVIDELKANPTNISDNYVNIAGSINDYAVFLLAVSRKYNDVEESFRQFKRAILMAERSYRKDDELLANLYGNFSEALLVNGHTKESLLFMEKSVPYLNKLNYNSSNNHSDRFPYATKVYSKLRRAILYSNCAKCIAHQPHLSLEEGLIFFITAIEILINEIKQNMLDKGYMYTLLLDFALLQYHCFENKRKYASLSHLKNFGVIRDYVLTATDSRVDLHATPQEIIAGIMQSTTNFEGCDETTNKLLIDFATNNKTKLINMKISRYTTGILLKDM